MLNKTKEKNCMRKYISFFKRVACIVRILTDMLIICVSNGMHIVSTLMAGTVNKIHYYCQYVINL